MTNRSNVPVDGEDLVSRLTDSTVLTEDRTTGDVDLTEGFRRDWRRRIRHFRTREPIDFVALLLDTDPDSLTIDETDDGLTVQVSGTTVGEWPSKAALVADVAAFLTLQEALPEWGELEATTRDELIGRLRVFLKTCPTCDGSLDTEQGDNSHAEPPRMVCTDCGAVLV
ncbi:zinc ribbon domain-containing protein [Halorubrum ezzemoulense]|uniref:zinc ribbon domain-containing protein n=1 Tax=Halorubrum ezzemoulense TaxID=337243 RepID=UPI00232EEDB6|nr:zinc ribbon domain-containing protein [Halorubrum ezzemoulense]MDB9234429.1 zinc ribbon domain-containing protein [Halorubrum ezzemoulense]